jgi:hypothetical protein
MSVEFARRRLFYQKQDLQLAWEGVRPAPRLLGSNRKSGASREALTEAGHFLGGVLINDRFRIFKNGGIPLLERRSGPMIEEIVLRASPYVREETYLPIRVYLHLSHSRLRDVRVRYWRPASRAPGLIAAMDLGQLQLPPCYVIWNVGSDYEVLVELLDWVRNLALPWFDLFEDSGLLRRSLYAGLVSGLDLDRALEVMIAEFGTAEGANFLRECVISNPHVGPRVLESIERIRATDEVGTIGADPARNIAAISHAYSLI